MQLPTDKRNAGGSWLVWAQQLAALPVDLCEHNNAIFSANQLMFLGCLPQCTELLSIEVARTNKVPEDRRTTTWFEPGNS